MRAHSGSSQRLAQNIINTEAAWPHEYVCVYVYMCVCARADTLLPTRHIAFKSTVSRGPWLAQSVAHVTLDLGIVGSRPTLGGEIT